jgi:hypothetical protein
MKKLFCLIFIIFPFTLNSQEIRYINQSSIVDSLPDTKIYHINDSLSYYYVKPRPFAYIKHSMQDLYLTPMVLFKKESILPALGVAASTLLLIAYDEPIIEAAQQFGRYINLNPDINTKNISPFKSLPPFYVPADLSAGLYYIGDGLTEFGINAGFYVYSLITKDPRARQTASQLSEGMIATGIYVQALKRITGRMTARRGNNEDMWRWFPSFKAYQDSVSSYDAFPSGHLAIAMMTTTVISMNYPEKKFIKPVGYTLIALCGYQMLNNGVHWASDYPLAIALGYTVGKIAANRGKKQIVHDVNQDIRSNAGIIKPDYKLKPAYLGYGASGLKFTATF